MMCRSIARGRIAVSPRVRQLPLQLGINVHDVNKKALTFIE
jgi:hypothetical protein